MRIKVISCVICALIIVNILVVEVTKDVSAQITEEWVAKYNKGTHDFAHDITVDSLGNVYVTGKSNNNETSFDYATLAYDPLGNQLWLARYNGPGNSYDSARAIVTDSQGNIYVTGGSGGDWATIAYDSSGNELWVARYNGPGNDGDGAIAIAVGPSRNIYVTGCSFIGKENRTDFTTIAYDSSGNELWIARYNGPVSGYDYANDIAIDSSENVYVTGYSGSVAVQPYLYMDYATVAYDSSGNELWSARYSGPDDIQDKAFALDLDSYGNVYVTGMSYDSKVGHDYATVAYNSSGKELWVARYNGIGNGWDEARAISIAPSGNIYVTGISSGHMTLTDDDYATVAYDSSGKELWVARYNGPVNLPDGAESIITDLSGNIYVTGHSWGGVTRADYATVCYDSSGNEKWVARYDGAKDLSDRASAIACDSQGNIFVTGYSKCEGTNFDYCTIKYSPQGQILTATIDIEPDTLNLKSKGRWITCYIDLPGYNVNDIDIKTVLLEDTIPAEWGDIQGDTLMVKFDRSDVEDMLSPGTYNLKVTGELTDGTEFEGYSDEIRVIDPGK